MHPTQSERGQYPPDMARRRKSIISTHLDTTTEGGATHDTFVTPLDHVYNPPGAIETFIGSLAAEMIGTREIPHMRKRREEHVLGGETIWRPRWNHQPVGDSEFPEIGRNFEVRHSRVFVLCQMLAARRLARATVSSLSSSSRQFHASSVCGVSKLSGRPAQTVAARELATPSPFCNSERDCMKPATPSFLDC